MICHLVTSFLPLLCCFRLVTSCHIVSVSLHFFHLFHHVHLITCFTSLTLFLFGYVFYVVSMLLCFLCNFHPVGLSDCFLLFMSSISVRLVCDRHCWIHQGISFLLSHPFNLNLVLMLGRRCAMMQNKKL